MQQLTSDGNLMYGSALAAHIQGAAILSFAAMTNGSVLVGRWKGIFRFLPNGDADGSFRAPAYRQGKGVLTNVSKIQNRDDKILVLYGFEGSRKLLRLNWDGSVDLGFYVPELRVDYSPVSY